MTERNDNSDEPVMTRRGMLMKLGLAATAIYTAPVLLQLNEAKASGGSWGSRGSGRRRRYSYASGGRRRTRARYSYGSGGRRQVSPERVIRGVLGNL